MKRSGWSAATSLLLIIPLCSTVKLDFDDIGDTIVSTACSAIGRECCRAPFVTPPGEAVRKLKKTMGSSFFGQHVAAEVVLQALASHLDDEDSNKALVLSFHGWAGSGKSYLAELIGKALYQAGTDSRFYKYYTASYHFPDSNQTKILEYQEQLQTEIHLTAARCERSLFVFDEVDKTPPKVFDALVPFIRHPGKKFNGVNFKRSIFIFLSNIGASDITRITYKHWEDGGRREDLSFSHFEQTLQREAFNNKDTGLSKSSLIDRILVDFYVPFLPMEREHIVSCVKAENERTRASVDPEQIADSLVYWPTVEKLYSQSGCKKVENLVKYFNAQGKFLNDEEDEKKKNEL